MSSFTYLCLECNALNDNHGVYPLCGKHREKHYLYLRSLRLQQNKHKLRIARADHAVVIKDILFSLPHVDELRKQKRMCTADMHAKYISVIDKCLSVLT